MTRFFLLLLVSVEVFLPTACAQEVPQQTPVSALVAEPLPQTVEVSSTKDPELKPYRTMVKGLDAYEQNRKMAPLAPIRFILTSRTPNFELAKLGLRIAGDTVSIPIELAADGSFSLPRSDIALDEKADIVLNVKKNLVGWRPFIRTPNLPANQMRLGDLRLECEIRWAIEYDESPFFIRNLFRLAGGPCHSSKIAYDVPVPKLLSVKLTQGERTLRLTQYRDTFYPPLHDESWSDDSVIELSFSENAKTDLNAR